MPHIEKFVVRQRPPMLARVGEMIRSFWIRPLSLKDPALAQLFRDGHSVAAGVHVNQSNALNYSPVWAAVSLIASDVGSLPLLVYERQRGGGKTRATTHRLYSLLRDAPNPEMTAIVFRETLQAHILTWGNGYAEIERNRAGQPLALWPLTPDRVQPIITKTELAPGRFSSTLRYRIDGDDRNIIEAANMIHVPGLGFDGRMGYSVIAHARESIGLGLVEEQFGATYFANGSTFGGVLSTEQDISPDQAEDVRKRIEQKHQSADRAHRFLVLGNDFKFSKLGVPPNDAQFLESRKFQVAEIARWFRVPLHKLGDLDRATFSNIEAQQIDYFRGTLAQWLARWEQELNRKLFTPAERQRFFAEHLVEGALRGDAQGRADFYTKLFGIGAISTNEIRDRENLNPVEGGDQLFVPLNMAPLNGPRPTPAPAELTPRAVPTRLEIDVLTPEDKEERGKQVFVRKTQKAQRRQRETLRRFARMDEIIAEDEQRARAAQLAAYFERLRDRIYSGSSPSGPRP